ncbi:hypothetical protein [Labedella endophytica]|uniref:Uncharacterized protein n=1 Tax=Labedella endophytica TaxID=1523160 RepID=A0A3S0VVS9_9MICO|nr:hypothetical protein [Labedella endophytica]RUR03265.1 hypothetical protein ELQ94_01560 [Labedella endophytica]
MSFPVGAAPLTRTAVRLLVDRFGTERISIVTGAALAGDPDAELGHLVSVDGVAVGIPDGDSLPHGSGDSAFRRLALAALLTDAFPLAEWSRRLAAAR